MSRRRAAFPQARPLLTGLQRRHLPHGRFAMQSHLDFSHFPGGIYTSLAINRAEEMSERHGVPFTYCLADSNQFSTLTPGYLEKSFTLLVTTVTPSATAWAAISLSR